MVVTINETKTSVASGVVMLISLLYVIINASVIASDWINFKKSHVLKRSVVSHALIWKLHFRSYWRTLSLCLSLICSLCQRWSLRRPRSRNELGCVYGTISRSDYLQSLPELFFFRIFKVPGPRRRLECCL